MDTFNHELINTINSFVFDTPLMFAVGNIRNIIFQIGQFNCATDMLKGKYNSQNIYNMNPTDLHYSIADWALSGNTLNAVGECLWFMNPFKPTCPKDFPYNGTGELHTRIINHCFYSPTDIYTTT